MTTSHPSIAQPAPIDVAALRERLRSTLEGACHPDIDLSVPSTDIVAILDAMDELAAALKNARDWLGIALYPVEGKGPPNWDGLREALKETDAALAKVRG